MIYNCIICVQFAIESHYYLLLLGFKAVKILHWCVYVCVCGLLLLPCTHTYFHICFYLLSFYLHSSFNYLLQSFSFIYKCIIYLYTLCRPYYSILRQFKYKNHLLQDLHYRYMVIANHSHFTPFTTRHKDNVLTPNSNDCIMYVLVVTISDQFHIFSVLFQLAVRKLY